MSKLKILVLGGYGNFGKRICESVLTNSNIDLLVAGRSLQKAENFVIRLKKDYPETTCIAIKLDCFSKDFTTQLNSLSPFLVIHTAGPFQCQDYRVPQACIASKSHYLDLADDRRYVCDISTLNSAALAQKVSIISGASSVPGLSSTVVSFFQKQFSEMNEIDIAIAPGNQAERGLATLEAILSYTGHPFTHYKNKKWNEIYGWMDSRKQHFGKDIGTRLLANINIPDLELFVTKYPNISTVSFQAGLELPILHYSMVLMAWLAKKRIIKNWANYSKLIYKISKWFNRFGTDVGGMQIILTGKSLEFKKQKIIWSLIANNGIGPYIPTFSACILAHKLINGEEVPQGAMPCMDLFSLEEFYKFIKTYPISYTTEIKDG